MIKSEIIALMSSQYHNLPEADVAMYVNKIIDSMTDTLCKGDRIEIRGFGSFSNHLRRSRKAHNPKTGEKVITEDKYTPHFKPGKLLREEVDTARLTTSLKRDSSKDDSDE